MQVELLVGGPLAVRPASHLPRDGISKIQNFLGIQSIRFLNSGSAMFSQVRFRNSLGMIEYTTLVGRLSSVLPTVFCVCAISLLFWVKKMPDVCAKTPGLRF